LGCSYPGLIHPLIQQRRISNEFKGLQSAAALDDLALGCCNTYGAGFVDAIAIHIPGIAH
jgi:hypothetical protein